MELFYYQERKLNYELERILGTKPKKNSNLVFNHHHNFSHTIFYFLVSNFDCNESNIVFFRVFSRDS